MPKQPTQPSIDEAYLAEALHHLNLFCSDESMWFPTWAKKEHVDLFDAPIPIDANYYKRSMGTISRPMILSERSLARLYYCLSTANPLFGTLAQVLAEEERLLIEEVDRSQPGGD
ncbi:MAG: hypothetical protein P4L99_13605 [Chthoniobacter sp.]|nr:hypothetical protein [Chthoniobacter sp.]